MRIVPEHKAKIKIGEEFERLTVAGRPFYIGGSKQMVVCQCTCGNYAAVIERSVRSGATRSCGCLRKEVTGVKTLTHGQAGTRLHHTWKNMRQRCENRKCGHWPRYGGRGIQVCEEWKQFAAFYEWSMRNGYQDNLTIERIKNNLGYSPGNCRWATMPEQMKNKRNNRFLTAFGETRIMADWLRDERCTVSLAGLRQRLDRGMSVEDALTTTGSMRWPHGV